MKSVLFGALLFAATTGWSQPDPSELLSVVRSSPPLTPNEELAAFEAPPGFEVTRFASEPDILKPMNMAFDGQGRLWVTVTQDYPFPAENPDEANDALIILEDTDQDGAADVFKTFADGLSIPIGVYPYRDGAIVWSIPNILYLRDTDGDDVADQRDVLYGPLGETRDTHGMQNAFRRGYDGWLYVNHGYNNDSTLVGSDGNALRLNSGNTYRIDLDGRAAERFTWGQVNPFGSYLDRFGELYTADCHTRPLYQLIPGAHYPSFGKPHDGLGFAPEIMRTSHGSTAISGVAIYEDNQWPEPFRDNAFIGNVMTSRINRDQLVFQGSSPIARERNDFLISHDSWFRPVDLQFGPDGALYIADFYNRIIGHYEAPLDHPGRDRKRGRIWRVQYTGAPERERLNLNSADTAIAELQSENPTRRKRALDWLSDEASENDLSRLRERLFDPAAPEKLRVGALWALIRRDALSPDSIARLTTNASGFLNLHLTRALETRNELTEAAWNTCLNALTDGSERNTRAAARTLATLGDARAIEPLIDAFGRARSSDNHLRHQIRVALRDILIRDNAFAEIDARTLSKNALQLLAEVTLACPIPSAGDFALRVIEDGRVARSLEANLFAHVSRYLESESLDRLIRVASDRKLSGQRQLDLLSQALAGANRRAGSLPSSIQEWGVDVLKQRLETIASASASWSAAPSSFSPESESPWFLQARQSEGADGTAPFLSSLPPGGEALTGVLRSEPFNAPESLTIAIAGHRGFPDQPAHQKNVVRIRDARSHEILRSAYPPRNDRARDQTFDLSAVAGSPVYLEIEDGDTGNAYAWMAIGRIRPNVAPLPRMDPRSRNAAIQQVAQLVPALQSEPLARELIPLIRDASLDLPARLSAARAVHQSAQALGRASIGEALANARQPLPLRLGLARILAESPSPSGVDLLADTLQSAPAALQEILAEGLARTAAGAKRLLDSIESGQASARLLQQSTLQQLLASRSDSEVHQRVEALTQDLPEALPLRETIQERLRHIAQNPGDPATGVAVFETHCQVCHQIQGKGTLIGPQLDGIGARGAARLAEDIIDPNRNVDEAFKYSVITKTDGSVATGLKRRVEGDSQVFANLAGEEFSIRLSDIDSIQSASFSLMPATFNQTIPPEDFADLIAYLLTQ